MTYISQSAYCILSQIFNVKIFVQSRIWSSINCSTKQVDISYEDVFETSRNIYKSLMTCVSWSTDLDFDQIFKVKILVQSSFLSSTDDSKLILY